VHGWSSSVRRRNSNSRGAALAQDGVPRACRGCEARTRTAPHSLGVTKLIASTGSLSLTTPLDSCHSDAPWCGHCKKLAPAYEKVATHYHRASPQRVHVGRIDATQHAGLATQYEIKGYPTLILLRGGERVADYTGARTFEALVDFVDETLALPPGAPRSPSARKAAAPTRTKKKSVGAAAYYLYGKESLVWLFTEADSMTFAFAALATVVSFGVGLVVVLVAATTPSPR